MNRKKILTVVLGVAFALILSMTNARASQERPRLVHPLTGQAPANTFVVTKTTDSGDDTNPGTGTFRRALLDARNSPGLDAIVFDLPGSGVKTITLGNYLPISTDNAGVMIDGTASDDRIEIDFSNTSGHFGLHFMSSNNVVKGLTLNGLFDAAAIAFEGGRNNVAIGNYIGTNSAGTSAKPNHSAILLRNTSNNQIGGTNGVTPGGACTGDCNLLSGNRFHGIVLDNSRNNRIVGNYIGVAKNGSSVLKNNDDGILIADSPNNTVGGPTPQERNVISGNHVIGVEIALANSTNNLVQGNYIGVNSAGTGVITAEGSGIIIGLSARNNIIDGNVIGGHRHFGILIFRDAHSNEVKNNRIGISPFDDSDFGNRMKGVEVQGNNNSIHHNRIANNQSDGVRIKNGMNNRISQNEIFNNRTFGINLGTDAFTPNDPGDGDNGANGLQNFPTITSAQHNGSALTIKGTLNSKPNGRYTLEFFHNQECDIAFVHPAGEGKIYLGTTEVTTDGGGNASFTIQVNGSPTSGVISSTATDSQNNTSEFSHCGTITMQSTAPPKPKIIVPENGAPVAENPPLLDWKKVRTATRYVVILRDGSAKGPLVHRNKAVQDHQYIPPTLEPGKTYFWIVKACNATNQCSKSGWYSFTVP